MYHIICSNRVKIYYMFLWSILLIQYFIKNFAIWVNRRLINGTADLHPCERTSINVTGKGVKVIGQIFL